MRIIPINVAVPVDTYNPAGPINISVYASTNPLVLGTPPQGTATLVDQESDNFSDDVTSNDAQHAHVDFSKDIPVSALPQPPDGKNPYYFYVVIDDGLNNPVTSPLSDNPVTPVALTPTINAVASVVSNFATTRTSGVITFQSVSDPKLTDKNTIDVLTTSSDTTITITRSDGTVIFSGNDAALLAAESASKILYTSPTTGAPAPGYDSITVTATNTATTGRKQPTAPVRSSAS